MNNEHDERFDALLRVSNAALEQKDRDIARLKAENVAMREIVKALANGPVYRDDFGEYTCTYCGQRYMAHEDLDDDQPGKIEHTADCSVMKARSLLDQGIAS